MTIVSNMQNIVIIVVTVVGKAFCGGDNCLCIFLCDLWRSLGFKGVTEVLFNEELFQTVENTVRANGALSRFESECGSVLGRVQIAEIEPPSEIVSGIDASDYIAFGCSFDFYDATLGIALDRETHMPVSSIWITEQVSGTEAPSKEWIEYFIEELMGVFEADGSYGMPLFSFVNDTAGMTLTLTALGGL